MASIASPRIPVSGASTPTVSSRRTSLDTNRTSSPARAAASNATTPTAPRAARRNRAALRDYYNLKPAPAQQQQQQQQQRDHSVGGTTTEDDDDDESSSVAGSETTTESELGKERGGGEGGRRGRKGKEATMLSPLDAPDFDAAAYVAALLERESLAGVLRAESALLDEMRELDGARKALVYDNYAKLIAATDTIRGLRVNLEPLARATGSIGSGKGRGRQGVGNGFDDDDGGDDDDRGENLKVLVGHIADTAAELATTAGAQKEDVRQKVSEGGLEEDDEAKKKRENARDTVKWVIESPRRFKEYVDAREKEKAEEEWKDVQRLLDKWKGTDGVEEVREGCKDVLASA